ncbi:MAG: cytochrome c, partial [Chloroflexi bacterium]|nr:cytochrome c [Chloroflexota bacterium]
MRRFIPLFTLILAALIAAGCSLADTPVPSGPIQSGPLPGEETIHTDLTANPSASEGAAIYAQSCSACHGPEGAGGGQMTAVLDEQGIELPMLNDPELMRSRSPGEWFAMVSNGTLSAGGMMPPFSESLTEVQRWSVVTYLYTLGTSADQLAEGEAIYNEVYAECFGADGAAASFNDISIMATRSPNNVFSQYMADEEACPAAAELTEDQRWAATLFAMT